METNKTKSHLGELVRAKKADRVILGAGPECVFSTDTAVTGTNNNILVVGGSGSGKTLSIAEPFILESFTRSIVTTVTKKRIVHKYSSLLKDRGYIVWDLDFVHPEKGNIAYDPLDFISNYSDITFVAKSVVLANPQKKHTNADPYWDEAATSLLSAFIAYVLTTKENPSFADVLDMLDNLAFEEYAGQIRTNFDSQIEALAKKEGSNFIISNYNSFKKLPIRTASCVFGALNSVVDSVCTPELRKMFRMKAKVDFQQIAENRTALFVTASPVNPSLNCFINLFYAHTCKQLFEFGEQQPDGMLPIPVNILADDFATGCPIPLFDQYISIFREKQISVIILLQSEAQLSSLYGENAATTIINNCDTYVFMGTNDLSTAKNIGLRINKPIEDILYMKIGNQIVFRRGDKPKMGKRYNIFDNEIYKKVTKEFEKQLQQQSR